MRLRARLAPAPAPAGARRLGLRGALVAGACGIVCLLGPSIGEAAAAPGEFDASFGTAGTSLVQLGLATNGYSQGAAVAVQPDGRIVVVGRATDSFGNAALTIARFNADGTRDSSFGIGGAVIDQLAPSGHDSDGRAVAIQPDGKILAGGYTEDGSGNSRFAVVRLNPDGRPDPLFGLSGAFVDTFDKYGSYAYSLALQPDGKIVVAGAAIAADCHAEGLVARLTATGSLDPLFGAGGVFLTQQGSMNGQICTPSTGFGAVALQPDGQIVAAGSASGESNSADVIRLAADGSALDPLFGTGGKLVTRFATSGAGADALALQPDGKLVLGGDTEDTGNHSALLLARLNPDGSPDLSFGSGGRIVDQFGAGMFPGTTLRAVAIQPDGRLLTAGEASDSAGYPSFALARFNPDGSVDASFGSSGKVQALRGGEAFGVALQRDGKVLATGYVWGEGGITDVFLSRLIADVPPSAVLGSSSSVASEGQPIGFDASASSDPDGTIASYAYSFGDGSSASGPTASHAYTAPGSYQASVSVTDNYGLTATATRTVTITPVGEPAPVLANLAQTASVWVEGAARATVARRRPPRGTTFTFRLNEQAALSFAFTQRARGRTVSNRCLAETRRNRRKRRCSRSITAGVLRLSGHAGANSVRFEGRISATKALKPGRYTVVVTAFSASGARSAPRSLSFTIVRK